MIYVDASAALAALFVERTRPAASLGQEPLVASRLLEYEMWNRVHVRNLSRSHGEAVRELIGRIGLIELTPPVLERAREPFPVPVRTNDALHLASFEFLRSQGHRPRLASYDKRLLAGATALGFQLMAL